MRGIIYGGLVFTNLGDHLERDLAIPVDDTVLYSIRGLSVEGKEKIYYS